MPTALQGFRENNRERRGVGPPCQHSRAFSASGKGLKRWPLILSPTLRRERVLGERASKGWRRGMLRPVGGCHPSRRSACKEARRAPQGDAAFATSIAKA